MVPPVAIDIDGTMTTPDGGIDPQLFQALQDWPEPVVVATGKAFPYPVALCEFLGLPTRVVAENGGVACTEDSLAILGNGEAARNAVSEFESEGHDIQRGENDLHNRWRETEVSVATSVAFSTLSEFAEKHGQTVVDTGYSYHVKSPELSKADGLAYVAEELGRKPDDFVAVGDSENDTEMFRACKHSFAVSNADAAAEAAADEVTDASFAAGTTEALETLR
ncbi:phosphoglycolate phosphatase [Haloarcula sp. CBA1130]|uniref:phosphoglycolate phosphatase n=1 Tax=unclassified Haloarcula TaxID=2624677 RepID=UPI001247C0D2|nr:MULTISPECIES: phosphoglycolate phosphatase [unclassified Haloarcula]KAA9396069.1 phosphoglycolate phosphatase [Haloarcula sp. CBA1129]KAA9400401.1 phosphoglycolate phosphatase [Haloarcula sp. CBA1130]